jgi:hypothetical protein
MRRPLTTLGVACLAGAGTVLWVSPASAQKAGGGETNELTITNGGDNTQYVIDKVALCGMDDALDARTEGEQRAHGGPGGNALTGVYGTVRRQGT